jgi:transposase
MSTMARRARRKFSPEFKAETVKLVRGSGKTVGEVARELDLTETALRHWVQQADIDQGKGPEGALTTAEKEELTKLPEPESSNCRQACQSVAIRLRRRPSPCRRREWDVRRWD